MPGRLWNSEETERLKTMAMNPSLTLYAMGKALNRDYRSVFTKLKALGLPGRFSLRDSVRPSAASVKIKTCNTCKNDKPRNEFHKSLGNRIDGLQPKCKSCHLKSQNEYSRTPVFRQQQKNGNARRRLEAIQRYGSRCVCCGITHPKFLTFHHKNGDGASHRKEIGRGSIIQWLRKNDYPDTIGLLCWNCNTAIEYYGKCPHEEK